MSSYATLRPDNGLAVAVAVKDQAGSDDFNQLAYQTIAMRRVLQSVLGGAAIYAGGAAAIGDLTDGNKYPAVTLMFNDGGTVPGPWFFKTTTATTISFLTSAATPGNLYAVPATLAGVDPPAATGKSVTFVADSAANPAPDNSFLLGSGTIVANAFTTYTPAATSPTSPLLATMVGATAGTAGLKGLVPASSAGDQNKVLTAGGTWVTPTTGALLAANNLSDVANVATSCTNLGLGTGSNVQFNTVQALALTNQLVLGTTGGGSHTVTISAVAPSASRTHTISDIVGAGYFALSTAEFGSARVPYATANKSLTDSASMTFDTTNGLKLAAGSASALNLTDTGGTAIGGILFRASGSANLYSSAPSTLKTDGTLVAGTGLTVASLGGLLKATAGVVSVASAGTDYEAGLGNPGTDGWVLSSTALGARSWTARTIANQQDATIGGTGFSQALVLDGTGYVNESNSGWNDTQTRYGMDFWFKFNTSLPVSQRDLLGDWNASGTRGYTVFYSAVTGYLYAFFKDEFAGNNQIQILAPGGGNLTPVVGTWYHIMVAKTYITGAGQYRVWVNGTYTSTQACTDATTSGTGAGAFYIGRTPASSNSANITIQAVNVWRNKTLVDADATAQYNGGSGVLNTAGTDHLVFNLNGSLNGGAYAPSGSPTYGTGVVLDPASLPANLDILSYNSGTSKWINRSLAQIIGTGVTGVLKATAGVVSAASSGTDYAPATSGSSVLKGNGTGGFSAAAASDLSLGTSNDVEFNTLKAHAATNQLILGGNSTAKKVTISSIAPAADAVLTIPATGTTDTFALLGMDQTFTNRQTIQFTKTDATISGLNIVSTYVQTADGVNRQDWGSSTSLYPRIAAGCTNTSGQTAIQSVMWRSSVAGGADDGTFGNTSGLTIQTGHDSTDLYASPITTNIYGAYINRRLHRGTAGTSEQGIHITGCAAISLPADWASGTTYVAGDIRKPIGGNGYYYICSVGGTSGGSPPTWNTTIRPAGSTTDNTVTWRTLAIPNAPIAYGIYFDTQVSNAATTAYGIYFAAGGTAANGITWNNGTCNLYSNGSGVLRMDGSLSIGGDSSILGAFSITDAKNVTLGTTTGTKWGVTTAAKQAWWGATPVVQQVLATGAAHTVDDVITLLQTLGLCKQS